MKRTQIVDLFTSIRATFVSFFSIAMFVSLAVAIFLGIDWSGKALQSAAENAFDEGNFHDIEILFPYGLTDEDVKVLRKTTGVSDVAVGRLCFQTVEVDGDEYTMRVGASDIDIDKLKLVEGELPKKSGEIALKAMWAKRHGVEVGNELVLTGDEIEKETLKTDKFKVTALVECPAFLSNSANTWGASNSSSGSLDLLAWVPSETFDVDAFDYTYTWAGIRSDSLRGKTTTSDEYVQGSNELKARLEEVGRT